MAPVGRRGLAVMSAHISYRVLRKHARVLVDAPCCITHPARPVPCTEYSIPEAENSESTAENSQAALGAPCRD